MNATLPPLAKGLDFFNRVQLFFERETGQSLRLWMFVALLNCIMQVMFRRELASAPGEFSSLNTILGVVGLMVVPLVALKLAFTSYLALDHPPARREYLEALRAVIPRVTQTVALIWGGISMLLLFVLLPLLNLPRFSLGLFTLLIVLITLGGLVGETICQQKNSLRGWGRLLAGAVLARVIFGTGLAWKEPAAETGLAAFLLAGFITLIPVLRQPKIEMASGREWRTVSDRDFLLYLGATFSVLLAVLLFSSADRMIAQSWFGRSDDNNLGYVHWTVCDDYQTAGLLGRALLWGTQPLLLILFVQRSRLNHTTPISLKFFWIYLGVLWGGAVLLTLLGYPLSWLFCGTDSPGTYRLIPAFALAMSLLGSLQGLGVFALASRRYPESFVLGASSLAYTLLLYLTGRQPVLMLAYMFGGGLVALLLVLFIGIVRWGRKQP
jgi:hypothetical protein